MAAPVLTVTAIAVDAAYDDLTTITGGLSNTVGYNGSAYWLNASLVGGAKKGSNPEGLIETAFNDSGSAVTFGFTTHRTKTFLAHDAVDVNGNDSFASNYSSNSSQYGSIAQAQIDSGLRYTMTVDQKLRRFTWPGALVQGTFVVNATLADSSLGPVSLSLGAVAGKTDKWFQVSCRTLLPTTLTVEIRKTVAGGGGTQMYTQGGVIEPYTLPNRPRTFRSLQLHRANRS